MFKEKFITLDLNKPSEKETLGYSTSPDLESIGAKNSPEVIEIENERVRLLSRIMDSRATEFAAKLISKAKKNPRHTTSVALDFIPPVNILKIGIEAAIGRGLITKEKLSARHRIIYAIEETAMVFGLIWLFGENSDPTMEVSAVIAKIVSILGSVSAYIPPERITEIAGKALSVAADKLGQSKDLIATFGGQLSSFALNFRPIDSRILELKLNEVVKSSQNG